MMDIMYMTATMLKEQYDEYDSEEDHVSKIPKYTFPPVDTISHVHSNFGMATQHGQQYVSLATGNISNHENNNDHHHQEQFLRKPPILLSSTILTSDVHVSYFPLNLPF
eukprot:UN03754